MQTTILPANVNSTRANPHLRLTPDQDIEIYRLFSEEGMSTKDISTLLGLNQTTIPKVIKRVTGSNVRKYAGDVTYFDNLDTRLKAYFLGFIAADGCIVDNANTSKSDTLSINIHEKDRCILELFSRELNRETKLYEVPSKSQVAIRVNSQHICNGLRQYGLGYRKTLTMNNIFSSIPVHLHGAFTQGYFEGDGWIHQNVTPHKVNRKIYKFATIGFCGTQKFLHGLAEAAQLRSYAIKHSPGTMENSKEGIFALTFASMAEINRVFDFMYSNSTFRLDRKYSKFLPYVQEDAHAKS